MIDGGFLGYIPYFSVQQLLVSLYLGVGNVAVFKGYSMRWWIFIACIVLGTFMGIFFQHFAVTAPLFRDIVSFNVNIGQIDLLAVKFGFQFGMRLNLGTLFGGIIGLWVAR